MNFHVASNVFPKVYEVLTEKGFVVSKENDTFAARSAEITLEASNTIELLGLYYLKEYGWRTKYASDEAIEAYLEIEVK